MTDETTTSGRFERLEAISERVHRGRDVRDGSFVALKRIDMKRDEREVRALRALDSPYAPRYVTAGGELVTEWVDGIDLATRLARGPLSSEDTLALASALGRAVADIHQRGVWHCDIKPSNIVLRGGSLTEPVLIDFGVARFTHEVLAEHTLIGTPGFMSPEQARAQRVDQRADFFSLGCTLYACLTGSGPFRSESAHAALARTLLVNAVPPQGPEPLRSFVHALLAKNPDERPCDATELLAWLRYGPPVAAREKQLGTNERRIDAVLLGQSAQRASEPEATIIAAQHGGSIDWLANGAVTVSFAGGDLAADLACRVAECALALRRTDSSFTIAVGIGSNLEALIDDVANHLDRAPPATVALNPICTDLLAKRFVVQPHDGYSLLLSDEPTESHALLGRRTPCVGRQAELASLSAHLAATSKEGPCRTVLVTAAAGVGKSRLVHEFLASTSVPRWLARADATKARSPFSLLAALVRSALHLTSEQMLSAERIKAVIGHSPNEEVVDFLAQLLGQNVDGSATVSAARRDPLLMAHEIQNAIFQLLALQLKAVGDALLICIDDVQWADRASMHLLDAVLSAMTPSHVMLLASGRPDAEATYATFWTARDAYSLRLSTLTRQDSAQLVRFALGDSVSNEQAATLVMRSAGNAFYLEELIRAAAAHSTAMFPDTVLAMAQSRLEALAPEARRVLRIASVFGEVFRLDAVARLAANPADAIAAVVHLLLSHEIIEKREHAAFAFRHSLLREAAYAMLTRDDRQSAHAAAAAWLKETDEGDAAVLAEHYVCAEQLQEAASSYCDAAAQALAIGDFTTALARIERARSYGPSRSVQASLSLLEAEVRLWQSEYAQADECAARAMQELPTADEKWFSAAGILAESAAKLGRHEQLRDLGHTMLAVEVSHDMQTHHAVALGRMLPQLYLAGEKAIGDALLSGAPDGFAQDTLAEAWLNHARSVRALCLGDLGAYVTLKRRVAQAFSVCGELRHSCAQRAKLGYGLREIGCYEASASVLQEALVDAQRMKLVQVEANIRHNLGLTLAYVGRVAEGRVLQEQALQAFRASGDKRLEAAALMYLALIAVKEGELDRALDAALSSVERGREPPLVLLHGLAVCAQVMLRRDEPELALAQAEKAMHLLNQLGGTDEGESALWLSYVMALRRCGKLADADRAAGQARDRLLQRAASISDPELRATFLNAVENNRAILALTEETQGGS